VAAGEARSIDFPVAWTWVGPRLGIAGNFRKRIRIFLDKRPRRGKIPGAVVAKHFLKYQV
jgi:hypothetical protein